MSRNSSLVSVILCFYNEENFLPEAINSVLSQTYPHWELLLVDDGSTDGSTALARELARSHPEKVKYIEHPGHVNKGLSASRNAGLGHARGAYYAFLDADDVWLPEKLSNQLAIFRKYPAVTVVLEASQYWRSWTGGEDVTVPVGAAEGIYTPPTLMLDLYPLGSGAAPCPSGIMVRDTVMRRCNFEESFRGIYQMYEDQAFLCKVYLKEVVFVSASCHNRYRQRAASLVSRVHEDGKYNQVRQYYLDWFRKYLRHQPLAHKRVHRLLDRAEMPYRQPMLHRFSVTLPRYAKQLVARMLVRLGILSYRKSW